MENRRNFYRVLRLQPEASTALITRVYRVLMQQVKLHPDLGGDTWNAALINTAYRTLSRPQSRTEHDRELADRGLTPKMIGIGPLTDYHRHAATARHHNVNRRHYARVLQLQLDAEEALINSARNWALSDSHAETQSKLINRAHALLIDQAQRNRYTELLSTTSHNGALAQMLREQAAETSAEGNPNTESPQSEQPSCPYCACPLAPGTPTAEATCVRCDSPLTAPPDAFPHLPGRRRRVVRVGKADHVLITAGWPAKHYGAYLIDASPHGVSFVTSARLHHLRVARVDGAGLCGVIELTHGRTSGTGHVYGGRFLSAHFDTVHGTFLQKTA